MNYLTSLKHAIHNLHGCDSRHVRTVHVSEVFKGQTIWDGDVEVFALVEHSTAKTAYAWVHMKDKVPQFVTVLQLPPVDSPESAVKISLAAEFRAKLSALN